MAGLRSRTRPPAPLPYRFRIDGDTYTITAHPVRWWVRTLAAAPPGCWWHVVPLGLDPAGRRRLIGRLLDEDDPLDLDDVEDATVRALTDVMGMDMWAAHRLMGTAYANWMVFDGWAASHGFDPAQASHPARVAAAVYTWRLGACEKQQDVTKLDNEIFAPPPLRTAAGRLRDQAPIGWDDAQEAAAFEKAVSNLTT